MRIIGRQLFPYCVITPLLLAISLLCSADSSAEVYRWVDEDGKVHFSDKKPGDKPQSLETIEVKPPQPVDNPELRQTLQQNRERFKALDAERELQAKQQQATAQAKRRRKQRCDYLRRKLAATKKSAYIYTLDKNGERVIQEEKTKQKAIRDMKKFIDREC